ncbi:MAG: hypothetical protein A4E19_06325 [Nitrospira sp. SG-bin1]|nr:MAG: hypothetical protein A4E19_06325 [Nitrospira sp. SG-bin1]
MIDDESVRDTSDNEHFQDIVNMRLSRRSSLTGFAAAAVASLGGVEALLKAVPAAAQETEEADDTDARIDGRGDGGRCSGSKVCRPLLPTRWWSPKAIRPKY